MSEKGVLLMTTVNDGAQARSLAARLIEDRLAACVQEIPIHSHYRWEGKLQRSSEILLLVKTSTAAADAAMQSIEKNHEYEVPEIIALPIAGGLPAYLKWLVEETGGHQSSA
jgi:periplasmic divalent cation tolerance protein